jgi:hypothetical protein
MANYLNRFDPCEWFKARVAAKERAHRLRVQRRREEREKMKREKLTAKPTKPDVRKPRP